MSRLVRLSSSYREIPASAAFERARGLASDLGITRVTEITWLDRIGVPVFVSVRPNALVGSLCVNAGKGMLPEEARVGALMEAIEYAWAEPGRSAVEVTRGCLRDILDGRTRPSACIDLSPVLGQTLDLDEPIDCVEAHDVVSGEVTLVPEEMVFHPLRHRNRRQFYGTGTNGLASGSSVDEATLHALAEVIERDVVSFHRVVPESQLVRIESLPPSLRELAARLRHLDFDLHLRTIDNPFGLPCFAAVVSDRNQWRMTMRGEGCHPVSEIAAIRAVTESIQARLSLIHGGRDDLVNVWSRHEGRTDDEIEARYRGALTAFGTGVEVDFAGVIDRSAEAATIPAAIELLGRCLAGSGIHRLLRVVYTPADCPVQVVRIIVPGLENYTPESRRVGPRLRAFAQRNGRSL